MKLLWNITICISLLFVFNAIANAEEEHHHAHHGHGEDEHRGEHEEEHHHAHGDADHSVHGKNDPHAHEEDQNEDGHEEHLLFSEEELEEFDIQLDEVGPGSIKETLALPGEITLDPDRLIHIVPRVSGITKQVYKTLGDSVKTGDLLATLSSREFAEIKAETMAAKSRYELASKTYEREKKLKKEGITSEREFLEAQQLRDNAFIEYKLAEQKSRAVGIKKIDRQCHTDCDLTLYEIRSPGDGVVTEKHIVQGELLHEESRPFVISNLDRIWVNLTVYQKDLEKIKVGQQVRVISGYGIPDVESVIDYISPTVSEETRSASARVVIDNTNRKWRPGLFVSVEVTLSDFIGDIVIPKTAIESIDDESVVFINTEEGFKPHTVKLGRSDDGYVEILEGLTPGEQYVAKNAFVLKAQMQKSSFGDGHAH